MSTTRSLQSHFRRGQQLLNSFSPRFSQRNARLYSDSRLPTIAQAPFWSQLIPKPLRRSPASQSQPKPPLLTRIRAYLSKPWNPATVFIIMPLLIGSQEVHIITKKREVLNYTRHIDAKIEVLREVLRRVQNGEEVDVKKALGTGDEKSEEEWRGVMKELQQGVKEWGSKSKSKEEREAARLQDNDGGEKVESRKVAFY